MWVWYLWTVHLGWTIVVVDVPMPALPDPWHKSSPESCMMIPGTYAQMREDYD